MTAVTLDIYGRPLNPAIDAHDIRNDEPTVALARVTPADPAHVAEVLARPLNADGRSDWVWLRLANGTLLLGVFPHGDTYLEFSDQGVADPPTPVEK